MVQEAPVPADTPIPEVVVIVSTEAEPEAQRPPIKQLSLQLPSRTQTLESPGFLTEAELPIISPPSEEQVASEVAAMAASLATDVPVDFPPSPMTSQPKTLLTPVQGDLPKHIPKMHITSVSPNSRRKFIISKVVEAGSFGTSPTHLDNHSTCNTGEEPQGAPASQQSLPVQQESEASADVLADSNSAAAWQFKSTDLPVDSENNCASSTVGDVTLMSPDQNENVTGTAPAALLVNGASGSDTIPAEDANTESSATSGDTALENITLELNGEKGLHMKMGDSGAECDARSNMNRIQETSPAGGTASKVGPDFHTSLSLNGMKVELATVLDNLEKTDFTKDAMEAGIKKMNNIIAFL